MTHITLYRNKELHKWSMSSICDIDAPVKLNNNWLELKNNLAEMFEEVESRPEGWKFEIKFRFQYQGKGNYLIRSDYRFSKDSSSDERNEGMSLYKELLRQLY